MVILSTSKQSSHSLFTTCYLLRVPTDKGDEQTIVSIHSINSEGCGWWHQQYKITCKVLGMKIFSGDPCKWFKKNFSFRIQYHGMGLIELWRIDGLLSLRWSGMINSFLSFQTSFPWATFRAGSSCFCKCHSLDARVTVILHLSASAEHSPCRVFIRHSSLVKSPSIYCLKTTISCQQQSNPVILGF